MLNGKYGDFPDNIILNISGREALDPAKWNPLKEYTVKIPLKPFTEDEAKKYLTQRGITTPLAIENILSISGRLPVYLSLLAENDPASPDDISDPNEKVVERFLKHIKDPIQRKLALEAALPRKLNKDIIACLISKEVDTLNMFNWLKSRPFVQKRGGHWTYHPIVRETMLRYQREISESDWETIHLQIGSWYQGRLDKFKFEEKEKRFSDPNWQVFYLEKYYHLLSTNFKKHFPNFIKDLITLLRLTEYAEAIPFTTILNEFSTISDALAWKDILLNGISALMIEEPKGVLNMVDAIEKTNWIEAKEDKALLYFWRGFYELDNKKAIEYYDKAISFHPLYSMAFNNRGVMNKNLGNKDLALKDYNKAIEIDPNNTKAYNNRGLIMEFQGKLDDAEANYSKALQIDPNNVRSFLNRGVVLGMQKKYDASLKDFDNALNIDSNNARVYHNRGVLFLNINKPNKALSDFEKAIELNPNYWQPVSSKANLLKQLEKYDLALIDFNRVVSLEKNNPRVYLARANFFKDLEEWDKALQDFNKIIELAPEDPDSYYRRGNFYIDQKEYSNSTEDFKKAISLYSKKIKRNPSDSHSIFKQGWASLVLHHFKEAKQAFSKVLELKNKFYSYSTPMNLGHIHLIQNDTPKAIEWYNKAIKKCKDKKTLNDFWEGMNQDYIDIKMSELNITSEFYQKIIKQLKNEHSQ